MVGARIGKVMGATLIVALVASCGSNEGDTLVNTITVTSAGGGASLAIPAGALPNGVSATDIRVTELDPADLLHDSDGIPALGGGRLEPDGLVLNKPVTLTVTVPTASIQVPVVLLFSKQSVEVIPNLQVTSKPEEELMTLSFELSHFSDYHVITGYHYVDFDSIGTQEVGRKFNLKGRAYRTNKEESYNLEDFDKRPFMMTLRSRGPWELSGSFHLYGQVTPNTIKGRPPSTKVEGDTFSIIQPLTCLEAGYRPWDGYYYYTLDYDEESTVTRTDSFGTSTTKVRVDRRFVDARHFLPGCTCRDSVRPDTVVLEPGSPPDLSGLESGCVPGTKPPEFGFATLYKGGTGALIGVDGHDFDEDPAKNVLIFEGGVAATGIRFLPDLSNVGETVLFFELPTGAKTGPVNIASPAGCRQAAFLFTVTGGIAPDITSMTPSTGPTYTPVTLTGAHFTGATNVYFQKNGLDSDGTTPTVTGDSMATFKVPGGLDPGTYHLQLVSPEGPGDSPIPFTVTDE